MTPAAAATAAAAPAPCGKVNAIYSCGRPARHAGRHAALEISTGGTDGITWFDVVWPVPTSSVGVWTDIAACLNWNAETWQSIDDE